MAGTLAFLRGWLIAVSLTGGCADWRDTIVGLSEIRRNAERFGEEVSSYFVEIAATADRTNQLGISEMSTHDLILYCGGITPNEKLSPDLTDPRAPRRSHPLSGDPKQGGDSGSRFY